MNMSASISYVLSSEILLTNACVNKCGHCVNDISNSDITLFDLKKLTSKLKGISESGATEVVFYSGEEPQNYPEIQIQLYEMGFSSIYDYYAAACKAAVSNNLIPVLNAGYLDELTIKQFADLGTVMQINVPCANLTEEGQTFQFARNRTPLAGKRQIEILHNSEIPYSLGFTIGVGETESDRLSTIASFGSYCAADPYLQNIRIDYFQPEQSCKLKHRPPLGLESVKKVADALKKAFPVHFISIAPHLFSRYPQIVEDGLNDLGSVPVMTSCVCHPSFPVPGYEAMKAKLAKYNIHLFERCSVSTSAAASKLPLASILPVIEAKIEERNNSPISLIDNDLCFVCGKRNPIGLKIPTKKSIKGNTCSFTWTTGPYYQSYAGILHGGISCTLMDEAMGYAVMGENMSKLVVTADMTVKYKHPTPIGVPIRVIATVTKRMHNHIFAKASVISSDGTVLSEAEGHFVELVKRIIKTVPSNNK